MLKGFREFIARGNVIDLAVGLVLGLAFAAVVGSFVKDVLMPPIGLALGKVDFTNLFAVLRPGSVPGPYASLADAQRVGAVTLNYGVFINTIITLLIIALAVYFLLQLVNRVRQAQAPAGVPLLHVARRAGGHPVPALHLQPGRRTRPPGRLTPAERTDQVGLAVTAPTRRPSVSARLSRPRNRPRR